MSKATSSCLGGKHPKGFYHSMEQNDVSLLEFVFGENSAHLDIQNNSTFAYMFSSKNESVI